jgi:hypothetical protein
MAIEVAAILGLPRPREVSIFSKKTSDYRRPDFLFVGSTRV